MDVQMLVMISLETTAEIRRQEEGTGRHLPIIALTAHAMKGDRERCLEAGMDGYVSKPVQPRELFRAIEAATGSVGSRQSAVGSPEGPNAGSSGDTPSPLPTADCRLPTASLAAEID